MKSPMVTNLECVTNKSGYSELQVLMSGAGYYIGTMYTNVEEDGTTWEEPGSRDSGYYSTREEAERVLKSWEIAGDMFATHFAKDLNRYDRPPTLQTDRSDLQSAFSRSHAELERLHSMRLVS